jgi:hypothetical protein
MSKNASAANAANSIEPPPIIVTGPSFTIYGEIHNDIDNRFYERLYTRFTENDRVLLEKTTDPELLEMDMIGLQIMPDIEVYLDKIGGSEWMYTMGLIKGKEFEPIDIRVECGYPSQIELISLVTLADTEPFRFLDFIKKTMAMIVHHKEKVDRPGIKDKFYSFMPIMKLQFNALIENLQKGVMDLDIVEKLKINFQRLGVLLVDAHIIDLINENSGKQKDKKHLHIFVGARHAINLYECLEIKNLEIKKTAKGESIEPLKPEK